MWVPLPHPLPSSDRLPHYACMRTPPAPCMSLVHASSRLTQEAGESLESMQVAELRLSPGNLYR